MSLQITGIITARWDAEKITDTFSKREFAIEFNDGKYNQIVKFELVNDRCDLIDNIEKDEEVTVHFDLRGRVWKGNVYNTLVAWKIERKDGSQVQKQSQTTKQEQPVEQEQPVPDDDLPF